MLPSLRSLRLCASQFRRLVKVEYDWLVSRRDAESAERNHTDCRIADPGQFLLLATPGDRLDDNKN